jgi:hypothetical protein
MVATNMKQLHRTLLPASLLGLATLALWAPPLEAYITAPLATLGGVSAESTYVTVFEVDKVSLEKGVIVFKKVRDLKGKYPKDTVKHAFDLKNTPAHKGQGDVPIRPNKKDWDHALKWARPGKTALLFTRRYEPYGDFGHTYIDGCWYASMCPPRDWEHWYAIYSDSALLKQWHGGTLPQLIAGAERILAGKVAVLPVLAEGSVDDLRAGRAKLGGLRASTAIRGYEPKRNQVRWPLDDAAVAGLTKTLREAASRDDRAGAADLIGLIGPRARLAVPALADAVRGDASGTVRMRAAEALIEMGKEAKSALPALEAGLKDPRMASRKEVLAKLAEALKKLQ